MTPDVVVDIGNSRMKWGRVRGNRVAEVASLDLYSENAWLEQATRWDLDSSSRWVVVSVNPPATAEFSPWLGGASATVKVIDSPSQIPLDLSVDSPEQVGLDRLLACLGARIYHSSDEPFLVVQAGTALVVNWMDASGSFAGGAILPGLALMAKSLNEFTAQLPLVKLREPVEPLPGRTTDAAIRAGIFWASLGAILTLRAGFGEGADLPIFITGGDAEVLLDAIPDPVTHIPDLVLEGIRISAEALP